MIIEGECDHNDFAANIENLPRIRPITLNYLELQTVIYMFSDINLIDPYVSNNNHMSSIPYFNLVSFQDICKYVLFKYVKVEKFLNENLM